MTRRNKNDYRPGTERYDSRFDEEWNFVDDLKHDSPCFAYVKSSEIFEIQGVRKIS